MLTSDDVRELAKLVTEEHIQELVVEKGDHKLRLRRRESRLTPPAVTSVTALSADDEAEDFHDPSVQVVTSEVVGIFHLAPTRAGDPLVEVGEKVTSGQLLCLVESMRLNHEVRATHDGQLAEIIAHEGEPVEYGQALMLVAAEG